jgi:hypothetical protein
MDISTMRQVAPILNRWMFPQHSASLSVRSSQAAWFCRLRRAFATTKNPAWTDSVGEYFILDDHERRRAFRAESAAVFGLAQEAVAEIERDCMSVKPISMRTS